MTPNYYDIVHMHANTYRMSCCSNSLYISAERSGRVEAENRGVGEDTQLVRILHSLWL